MQINVTVNGGEINIDIQSAVIKSLQQSTQLVRGKAIKNAPVKSGTLRRSITTAMGLRKDTASVGNNLVYAKKREYVNKKNPHTKFYMKRAMDDSIPKIQKLFFKNIQNELSNNM